MWYSLGSFEVSFLKYLAIGEIGIGLIVICFAMCWDDNKAIAITGLILITICCIMSGLIIGLIGNNGLKYVLIFGIGSYIVFIIYVISAICQWEMKNVWISGGVILGICTLVDLILGSFEVSFLKHFTIVLIGLELIIFCYAFIKNEDDSCLLIFLIIIGCVMTSLIFGLIGKSWFIYILLFGIVYYSFFAIVVVGVIFNGIENSWH